MKYHVKATAGGKSTVSFECPHCQSGLTSPLEEAGQRFACPSCGGTIETPGVRELEKSKRELAAAQRQRELKLEAERERREHEQEQARAREAQRAERLAAAARAAEEAKQRAKAPDSHQPRRGSPAGLHVLATFAVVFIVVFVFYLTTVRPLQKRLADAQQQLDRQAEEMNAIQRTVGSVASDVKNGTEALRASTDAASRNAASARALADSVSRKSDGTSSLAQQVDQCATALHALEAKVEATQSALDSLKRTVNYNAAVANDTARALARDLDSLTSTVNYNARISNLNNSLR